MILGNGTLPINTQRFKIESLFKSLTFIMFMIAFVAVKVKAQNPNWIAPNSSGYQFSANYIAVIHLDSVASNDIEDSVAFFKDGKIRGVGSVVSIGNGMYIHFITVYAHQAVDTMEIKVYHKGTDHIYEVQQSAIFQVQRITGSVDDPYIINIYPNNDAPISILPVPPQFTLEGNPFQAIDMSQFLVQPDEFPVAWSYTPNPNLVVNLLDGILSVSAIDGFTGQTLLTIRATELGLQNQFDEVNIIFNVTPIYAAPLWHPAIPSQGILVGEQFDSIALHDFENQFQEPFIRYDYIPLISEHVPPDSIPFWQINQNFGTTMNVVTQINYTPKYQFNHADDLLAAFIDDEVRGVAQRNMITGLYYLTVAGGNDNGSKVTLKFFSGAMTEILIIDSAFHYQPYDIIGSTDSPVYIDFAPIIPIVPDLPVANGIYTMPVIIADSNFVGSVTFTFYALDPTYPQYLNDEINATFCIVTDSFALFTYYQDADGDGLGNPMVSIVACELPFGYVTNADDCNDDDATNSGIILSISENSGIPDDGFICPLSITTITVTQNAQTYHWSTGQTTQSIEVNPLTTTVYSVTVSSGIDCIDTSSVMIHVEGKIVMNTNNSGFGSLRNVVECAVEGDSIYYNFPFNNNTILTEPIEIQKNITINGTLPLKPEIALDFNNMTNGIIIHSSKYLYLNNVDIKLLNQNMHSVFSGLGQIFIIGSTNILHE